MTERPRPGSVALGTARDKMELLEVHLRHSGVAARSRFLKTAHYVASKCSSCANSGAGGDCSVPFGEVTGDG